MSFESCWSSLSETGLRCSGNGRGNWSSSEPQSEFATMAAARGVCFCWTAIVVTDSHAVRTLTGWSYKVKHLPGFRSERGERLVEQKGVGEAQEARSAQTRSEQGPDGLPRLPRDEQGRLRLAQVLHWASKRPTWNGRDARGNAWRLRNTQPSSRSIGSTRNAPLRRS